MSHPGHRLHVLPWLRLPGRLMLRNWLAITLGRRIFAWRDLDQRELAHELAHVDQWRRHGLWFPFAYLAASIAARRTPDGWYRGNRFEVEARLAADAEPPRANVSAASARSATPARRRRPG